MEANVRTLSHRTGTDHAGVPGRNNRDKECGFVAPRVVTFTPAPCVDKVYFLDRVRTGETNRAERVDTYFAGNGVNVARALHLAGNTVSAVLPIDRKRNAERDFIAELGEVARGIDVGSPLRTNISVVDESGLTTNYNSVPAPFSPGQWADLCQAVTAEVQRIGADWLVLGGTLPQDENTGRPVDIHPLFRAMRSLGVSVCLDSPVGSDTLSAWSRDGSPDLVKPNGAELSTMTGISIRDLGDVVNAANVVRQSGVGTVLASLGPDGILEVGARGVLWARGPETQVVNTTGAGDAALAGFLSVAHPGNPTLGWHSEALRRAVAWGALAVRQTTTVLPYIITKPYDVWIGPPDLDHQLT